MDWGEDWGWQLSRQGTAPAPWLAELERELEAVLRGGLSEVKRDKLTRRLLDHPMYGCLLNAVSNGLWRWESHLETSQDALAHKPSVALPVLLREFAQSLHLKEIDPAGSNLDKNYQCSRIGWLKNLTTQGCQVYKWERENQFATLKDWVPRVQSPASDVWPEAPSVELPIFLVAKDDSGNIAGLNGWLRLWLWPCENAELEWLPSVTQRVQPLAQSWQDGLDRANQRIRQLMDGQGNGWRNNALVWDVHTNEVAYDLLLGDSASATFMLAGLWLAREWAPVEWRPSLVSMTREHWRHARITAAIAAEDTDKRRKEISLAPVGGVREKSLANWVLNQGGDDKSPLYVAKQEIETSKPGTPLPWVHGHDTAFDLLKTLAKSALDLNEAQAALHGALQRHLQDFGPRTAQGNEAVHGPWHLPCHNPPKLGKDLDATVSGVVDDPRKSTQLVPFALTRWATRAHELHVGGQVHRLFVNLHVSDEGRTGTIGFDSLEQLLAEYEKDSKSPLKEIHALQIVGAPGSGKTWCLARFEQACAERLLWQLDWLASKPARIDVAEQVKDPFPYLTVPLYVALSELPADDNKNKVDIVKWFREQVLGKDNAPDTQLRRRLMNPGSEPDIRLRILLDGLNELKVKSGQTRQERAKEVVRVIWRELQPGLVMLLGTRTHHRYDLNHTTREGLNFNVAVATLQPWTNEQIKTYLIQRWSGSKRTDLLSQVNEIVAKLADSQQQRLREVLSLPLYLRIQCELLEAGAKNLLDSRARLLAALLWRNLHQEFIVNAAHGEGRSDLCLLTEQEREIASDFAKNSDQAPSAFPRKGRLLQGLFALAWQMWLAHADVPADARGQVTLPLDDEGRHAGASPVVTVRGCLRGLRWSNYKSKRDKLIDEWIAAAKDLGWLQVNNIHRTARFAHQAYGEFLASQQLFWQQPHHDGWSVHPQPTDWTDEGLAKLGRQFAPPQLELGCIDELEKQALEADALWDDERLKPLFSEWYEKGITVKWHDVEAKTPAYYLFDQDGSVRRYFREKNVLKEVAGKAAWSLKHMVELHQHYDLPPRYLSSKRWFEQASAWRYLLTSHDIWLAFSDEAQRQVAERLGSEGAEQAKRLWQARGRLPEAPPGALDEIVVLALEALPDPLPWLQQLLEFAKKQEQDPKVINRIPTLVPPVGCWAPLSLGLEQEAQRLDQLHPGSGALRLLRHESVELLLAVNQALDPELQAQDISDQKPAYDLRHRIQAGLCLGRQGALGSDAGDHVRFERIDGVAQGVRLKRKYWCKVDPVKYVKPFLIARYPVTIGEYLEFVLAGGYADENAPWWLQGLKREQSAARAWLLREYGNTHPSDRIPVGLLSKRFNNPLQPIGGVTLYEANAYIHWAAKTVYAEWLISEASVLKVDSLTLRLPTEWEWVAAMHGDVTAAWLGHTGSGAPSALLFNHQATGWGRTTPVGSFAASQSTGGLMDVFGNQWQWCANAFSNDVRDTNCHALCAADLANDQTLRALRGGSYLDPASQRWIVLRNRISPDGFSNNVGFRLVLAMEL